MSDRRRMPHALEIEAMLLDEAASPAGANAHGLLLIGTVALALVLLVIAARAVGRRRAT